MFMAVIEVASRHVTGLEGRTLSARDSGSMRHLRIVADLGNTVLLQLAGDVRGCDAEFSRQRALHVTSRQKPSILHRSTSVSCRL